MNYQQWNSVAENPPPLQKWVTVTPGGYVMRGLFKKVNGLLCCADWRGREHFDCQHWSWSETEPEAEMLMVKPHGIFMAHWWNEVGHLLNIIHDFGLGVFVEIGLLDGGLASMILSEVEYSGHLKYWGIDLHAKTYVARAVQWKAEFLTKSGHSAFIWESNAWSQQTVEDLSRAIHRYNDRKMIYCDGGDKAKEAHLYWPILRPGDLLGLHDYSDDPNAKGPEVFPKDVEDLLAAGKRHGREELKDTRILLLEKP